MIEWKTIAWICFLALIVMGIEIIVLWIVDKRHPDEEIDDPYN